MPIKILVLGGGGGAGVFLEGGEAEVPIFFLLVRGFF